MYSTELREAGWESIPWPLRLVVIAGLAFGLSALGASWVASVDARDAVQRVEREGLERDYALCSNANQARASLVSFVRRLVQLDDGAVSAGEQVYIDLAEEDFAQKPCPPDPSPKGDP